MSRRGWPSGVCPSAFRWDGVLDEIDRSGLAMQGGATRVWEKACRAFGISAPLTF